MAIHKKTEPNFSAIIVTYNEDRYLSDCLRSLAFCDQIIVIDLGSNDSSIAIAKACNAETYFHPRTITAEIVRKKGLKYAKNDWIIMMDPDEVLPKGIEKVFRSQITITQNLGVIYLPWQFYFKGKPLNDTIWGINNKKAFLYHRQRNIFNPDVHYHFSLLDGYESETLPRSEDYIVKHYWCDSYRQLFEKHFRYVLADGKARYNNGQRFTCSRWIKETMYALKVNLFDYNGINSGFRGLFLSFFYSAYLCLSYLSLYWHQKKYSLY